MIECSGDSRNGVMTISGSTPNGNAKVTRSAKGQVPFLLRNGAKKITTNGFLLFDTEAPFETPLTYVATITGISDADRLIQQNLVMTPTFTRGVFNWAAGPGAGRALTTTTDPSAHQPVVGLFGGSNTSTAPPAPPVLIGHVDTPVFGVFNYVLAPTLTGPTAIAENDWMLWIHQQLASVDLGLRPNGWTVFADVTNGSIRTVVWGKSRSHLDQISNTTYSVTTGGGALNIGTLMWVRGAVLDDLIVAPITIASGTKSTMTTAGTSVMFGHLTIHAFSGETAGLATPPGSTSVSGAAWQYTRSTGTNARTLTIAAETNSQADLTAQVTTAYADTVVGGAAISVSFPGTGNLTNRMVGKGQTALIPAAPQPYLLTGRFRFVTADLNTWSDIAAIGTWQQVKTAKADWLAVRGNTSTVAGDYVKLFLMIVNPATGAAYTPPVQIMDAGESSVNQWVDFSALFSTDVDIPAGSEIQLFHGTNQREYAVNWYFDEFGITPGSQFFNRNPLYWFDGDSPLPDQPGYNLIPDMAWTATTSDSSISWSGTPGNSASVYTGPSGVSTFSTCMLELPDLIPCEPIFLSDPVNTGFNAWVGLVSVGDLTHPAKQAIYQVLNRAASVANSQLRGWETGEMSVLTNTFAEREQLRTAFSSGRILLLRNPDPSFPEDNWYLACGDLKETRPIPNQRVPQRVWTFPFVRVERPTGLIEAATATTWADVKLIGTWADVRDQRADWLGVLTGEAG